MSPNINLPPFNEVWVFQDAKESEEKFKALMSLSKEKDLAYYAELIGHLGRSISLQKRYDDAHKILDLAIPILTDDMILANIRYNLERGRVYFWQLNRSKASAFFQTAMNLAIEHGEDFLAVDIAHMIAIVPEKHENQIPLHKKALELAENSSCPKARVWLATLNNNIGYSYQMLTQHDLALSHFKKALELRIHYDRPSFFAKWAVARAYRLANNPKKGLEILMQLYDEQQNGSIGHVFLEQAECELLLDKSSESKANFGKAYHYFCNFKHRQSQNDWYKPNELEMKRMAKLME